MLTFQLTELNAPLQKKCVGLLLESIISRAEEKYVMEHVFSKCWSPRWVTAVHSPRTAVYVTPGTDLQTRICVFLSSSSLPALEDVIIISPQIAQLMQKIWTEYCCNLSRPTVNQDLSTKYKENQIFLFLNMAPGK